MKPPARLEVSRANAWKNDKDPRSRYGRRSDFAVEALAHFTSINYQLRYCINNSRAHYEQQLNENYSIVLKLLHAYARKKKKKRMSV